MTVIEKRTYVILDRVVRNNNSDEGTLKWKIKLQEQTIQIYMIRIFQVDELFNAKAGKYSVCSQSSKEASMTETDKLEGHLLVIQHRSNQETRSYRVYYSCKCHGKTLLRFPAAWRMATWQIQQLPHRTNLHICAKVILFPRLSPVNV